MKTSRAASLPALSARILLCALALQFSILIVPAMARKATPPPRTFLGQVTDTTTAIHDNQGWTAATQGAEKLEEAFKKALEQGLATAEKAEKFAKLGKYVKILDYGLKIIKFGDLGAQGLQALYAGDRATFCRIFNQTLREAIKTVAGMAGAAGGAVVGTAAAGTVGGLLTLPAGGVGALITGGVGAFAGGWLGDFLGSEGAALIYDAFLQNWVKDDFANAVFDAMSSDAPGGPGGAGGAPPLPPPAGPGEPPSSGGGGKLDPFGR